MFSFTDSDAEKIMSQAKMTRNRDSTSVFVVLSIVIVALIIDTSIVKVYRFITPPLSLQWDITAFTAITIVFAVAQYFLLRQVRSQTKTSRLFALNLVHKIAFLIQCALTDFLYL